MPNKAKIFCKKGYWKFASGRINIYFIFTWAFLSLNIFFLNYNFMNVNLKRTKGRSENMGVFF